MKVLVTGAAGQAGVALAESAPGWATVTGADCGELDITDASAVTNLINTLAPDVVINAAAYTDVERAESEQEEAFAVNARGPENLARAAKTTGCRLIHLSTDYVFPGDIAAALQPDHPARPINVYGKSKLEGEQRVTACLGADALVLRTSWLYHPSGNNFVKTMLRLMNENDRLKVVVDQIGAPTSATTLANVIWSAIDKKLAGVHHWCDAGVASWYDFAVAVYENGRAMGLIDNEVSIVPVRASEFPTEAARPAFSLMDTSSTHAALDIPWVHWRDALKSMLEKVRNA